MNVTKFKRITTAAACVAALAPFLLFARDCDVRDFGAKGDGRTFDTAAVQGAIDACAAAGGGRVTLADGVYLVKPFFLKSGVDLHLERNARLLGSGDWRDYPNRGTLKHVKSEKLPRGRDAALITADEAKGIAITGPGVIDANGTSFVRPKPDPNHRWQYERIGGFDQSPPRVVFLTGCEDVTVRDVTMTNQPAGWSYWIHDCDRVVFDRVQILADVQYPNNDGIHINSSRDVSVANCVIETGDDSIIVRANNRSLKEKKVCERVTVANCQLRSYAKCIRLGWSADGVIRNCTFSNLTMRDSSVGIGIELVPIDWNPAGDFGVEKTRVENILFSNIVMDRIHGRPFSVKAYQPETCGAVRNISFSNLFVRSAEIPVFHGLAECPLENFTFTGCRFILSSAPDVRAPWAKPPSDEKPSPGGNPFLHCRNFTFNDSTFGDVE